MVSDCVHKQVSNQMSKEMGFPTWFPTLVGCWKLLQTACNWTDGGAYTHIAQAMMAFHVGGGAYAHAVAEGQPEKCGGCAVFFGIALAAQIHSGTALFEAVTVHVGLSALGFCSGYLVTALGKPPRSHKD